MEGNKIFAERVKAEKEKHNLTTTQLAEKLGINKSRISMWETNGTIPRQDMLLKLCTLFNVSSDYLLGNEVDMKYLQSSANFQNLILQTWKKRTIFWMRLLQRFLEE